MGRDRDNTDGCDEELGDRNRYRPSRGGRGRPSPGKASPSSRIETAGEIPPKATETSRIDRAADNSATDPSTNFAVPFGVDFDSLASNRAAGAIGNASQSASAPLPSKVRAGLENASGEDLSGVRVHTGSASQKAAAAIGAKAFTTGEQIHFGAGQYDPTSKQGRHLIAHEVAHTVQQRGASPAPQAKLEISSPTDSHEREAEAFAAAFTEGKAATISQRTTAPISRQTENDVFRRHAATERIKDLQKPGKNPRVDMRQRGPQLPAPDLSSSTEELVRYARLSFSFQDDWDELRKAATAAMYASEKRGLTDAEIQALRVKAKQRFYRLDAWTKHAANMAALEYAQRELELQKKAFYAKRWATYGPDPGKPSLFSELSAQLKKNVVTMVRGFVVNIKAIVSRSEKIRREALARGDFRGASFAALNSLALTTAEAYWSIGPKLQATIDLIKGDFSRENALAAIELAQIVVMGAVGRMAFKFGKGKSGPRVLPGSSGGLAPAWATAGGKLPQNVRPLSHEGIIGNLILLRKKPGSKSTGNRGGPLPAEHRGTWSGTPGNSTFHPKNPKKYGLKKGEGVPFKDGYVNFWKWRTKWKDRNGKMRTSFRVPGAPGNDKAAMRRIHRHIAKQMGWKNSRGRWDRVRVEQWLEDQKLVPHHHTPETIILVRKKLHGLYHHGGVHMRKVDYK